MPLLSKLFWLLGAHALTDYCLQDERMAVRKHPAVSQMQERTHDGPWWWWMLAHGLINGLGVAYVTQRWELGLAETLVHSGLDTLKCYGKLSTNLDQVGHLLSKLVWALV